MTEETKPAEVTEIADAAAPVAPVEPSRVLPAPAFVSPTPGRIVLYVAPDGSVRPAMVVRAWTKDLPGTSNLQVFTDGANDDEWLQPWERHAPPHGPNPIRPADGLVWRTSVTYDAGGQPGTWHWPPRG